MSQIHSRNSDIVSTDKSIEDDIDISLRPSSFDDFTGQKKMSII